MNLSASKIWNASNHMKISFNKIKLLPCYYQRCFIESTEQLMIVMKYEGEFIGNVE